MTQTQQNFMKTASKVEQMEKMVERGLSKGKDRQSQHSLEAEKMGLRRSSDGIYERINKAGAPVKNTGSQERPPDTAQTNSKVPAAIMEQML